MYLLIDAGNTRIKLGLHDGRDWLRREALPHDALSSHAWLRSVRDLSRVVISNVAGDALAQTMRGSLGGAAAGAEWLRATAERCGVRNEYERPEQLGADRWAAIIGAWHRVRGACLVVNAGTATTLDVLDSDGRFVGGCILPGLSLMQQSLARGTAGLPLVEGRAAELPRNTADAIFNGCLHAQLGAIARMRMRLPAGAPIALSGGAGAALSPWLDGPVLQEPWLVLDGLLQIARSA